jgi:hypothetical protein
MLTCFTGTTENKTALVTGVPMGRLDLSEEVADGTSSSRRTMPGSPRAVSSTSTAVTPLIDHVRAREVRSAPGRHGFDEGS